MKRYFRVSIGCLGMLVGLILLGRSLFSPPLTIHAQTPIANVANITLTKSVDLSQASIGAPLVYRITYTNISLTAAATNVIITDVVPDQTSFLSATGGGVFAKGVVTWPLGTVGPNTGGNVTFTVTITGISNTPTPIPPTPSPTPIPPTPTPTQAAGGCLTPAGTLKRVSSLDLQSGENTSYAGDIDETRGYGYFAPEHDVVHFVKIKLGDCDAAPTEIGSIALGGGGSGFVLLDKINNYGYVGVGGSLYKVNLGNGDAMPSLVGSLSIASGLGTGVIDPSNAVAYIPTSDARMVKVALGQGNALPQIVTSINLASGENFLHKSLLVNGYIYATVPVAQNSKLIKIRTNPLAEIGSTSGVGGNVITADNAGHLFTIITAPGGGFDGTSPGQIIELAQGAGDTLPSVIKTLQISTKYYSVACSDPNHNRTIYGDDLTFPASHALSVTSDAQGNFQVDQDLQLNSGTGNFTFDTRPISPPPPLLAAIFTSMP